MPRCMRAAAAGGTASLFVGSEGAGHAAVIYYSLPEFGKADQVNPLTCLIHILSNARNRDVVLPTPDEFFDSNTSPADGCAL